MFGRPRLPQRLGKTPAAIRKNKSGNMLPPARITGVSGGLGMAFGLPGGGIAVGFMHLHSATDIFPRPSFWVTFLVAAETVSIHAPGRIECLGREPGAKRQELGNQVLARKLSIKPHNEEENAP